MIVRIIKSVLNELVKFKGESIWEDYRIIQDNVVTDSNIRKWINIILTQRKDGHDFEPNNVNTPSVDQNSRRTGEVLPTFGGANSEISEILKEL